MRKLEVLNSRRADLLRAQDLTYSDVGRTATSPPTGYSAFSRSRIVQTTRDFEAVAAALTGWQMHRRAGLGLAVSSPVASVGAVVIIRAGLGRVSLAAPCRVVYVVDEANRKGFAYGTLPGHPETGEESFILTLEANHQIRFTITAFSRPNTRLAKVAGPIGRYAQRMIATRYLRALDSS